MSFEFWRRWLIGVTLGVIGYSACLILLPAGMQRLFNGLFFPSVDMTQFSTAAQTYISFIQGVLGAVIIGWMSTFMAILFSSFRPGQRHAWNMLALSMLVWFCIDSGFSLVTGVPAHAVFNGVFLVLFAIPLWQTRPEVAAA